MLHVFCAFDGTITEPDTLRFLTERLGAGPEHYRETGRLLCAGALSLREAVARDVGTIRAPFAEAAALLRAHVAVDPGFAPFARWCAAHAGPLPILSGGFEGIVELLQAPAQDGERDGVRRAPAGRSEEHTSELQSPCNLVCRLLLEKKKKH